MTNTIGPSAEAEQRCTYSIREIDANSTTEIDLIAARMRLTLIEVEGEEKGTALYDMDWLRERVRWHLDPSSCTGKVYVVVSDEGPVVGHTIVRVELDEQGKRYGLFSTSYVEPASRKHGLAGRLLQCGEDWMRDQGLVEFATWTSETNFKLIGLYTKFGYAISQRHLHDTTATLMVRLTKRLV